jgi:hypothetical protein
VVRAPTGRVVFVDSAGWYRRTADEAAVLTALDFSLGALPESLPQQLGPWTGFDRPHDPAVDDVFRSPDVTIERTYRRPDGEIVWLTLFGSRGPKSFHLFEHTPETCYPLAGWAIERFDTRRLALGPRGIPVNEGVASGPDGSLVFVHFYVWDTPSRDSERGVVTMRLAAPVSRDPDTTAAMLAADFVPHLFETTVAWSRF